MKQLDFFDKSISSSKNIKNYYVVKPEYFVYNPRISKNAPFGPINLNELNVTGIMSPLYIVFKTEGIDIYFLKYYFKSSNWHYYMYSNGDSGARSDRFSINTSIFFQMQLYVPQKSEQTKIGKMLKKIDKLIAANQRKQKGSQIYDPP